MTAPLEKGIFQIQSNDIGKADGLHWFMTGLFIVADMAGGGVVAMPIAMLMSGGFAGAIIIGILCAAFAYTAHLLGENWVIMCRNWPEYRKHCRKPYPEMAYRGLGNKARLFTSATINIMLYGVAIVYLLLSSKIISDLINATFGTNFGFCMTMVVVAAVLWPITLLKSPQDFWWAILLAMLTTGCAVVLILIGTANDYGQCAEHARASPFNFDSMILSLGTYMFSFGGHVVFPTIQHDMKKPTHFTRSVILAFIIVSAFYIPITALGFITYGDSLEESIINSIQLGWVQKFANLFIAIHCFLTLTIIVNPLNQELEDLFNIPHHFGIKRLTVRTVLLIAVLFSALSVPTFGPILNLIGGSAVALTSAIMPCLFNLYLKALDNREKDMPGAMNVSTIPSVKEVIQRTPKKRLAISIFVISVSIICGLATTYSALREMTTTHFVPPCYWPSVTEAKADYSQGPVHCCGHFRNITRFDDLVCKKID
uniref:Aa_trans domain-containing protein n=1 Tax=Steinernema glaseri TaxID=37863 RepID=A0A1I8A1A1_9BILA